MNWRPDNIWTHSPIQRSYWSDHKLYLDFGFFSHHTIKGRVTCFTFLEILHTYQKALKSMMLVSVLAVCWFVNKNDPGAFHMETYNMSVSYAGCQHLRKASTILVPPRPGRWCHFSAFARACIRECLPTSTRASIEELEFICLVADTSKSPSGGR